jgi:NhaC family Na+:H+ antiporter
LLLTAALALEAVDDLFSRGGMASRLTTVWLVLAATAFAAILEHAGLLERLLRPIVERARSRGSLVLATNASCIGLNVTAGDQYVADVLPARMFREEYERRKISPKVDGPAPLDGDGRASGPEDVAAAEHHPSPARSAAPR